MTFKAKFVVELKWLDIRLTFLNLKKDKVVFTSSYFSSYIFLVACLIALINVKTLPCKFLGPRECSRMLQKN